MTTPIQALLSTKEKAVIAAQGTLRALPYVGASLEHFMFGHLAELRMKRIERTLVEIAEHLGKERAIAMVSESFVNLLESVSPAIGRSTNEDKRGHFRNILINATSHPEGAKEWEAAALASELLKEIESPGLAILAALHSAAKDGMLTIASRPVPQVFQGKFDYENPGAPQIEIPYDWVVVEYWARCLRDRRLITFGSHDARGGFGSVGLAELGRFLVEWAVRA